MSGGRGVYLCFSFDLIVNSLQVGAADYIAVAENYHTVFISDIPMMSMRIRDKVQLLLIGLLVHVIGLPMLFELQPTESYLKFFLT